jgi:tRNA (guanine10-N2)-dimethyltransferase
VVDVFFLLSGEHPTLPWAELRSVLEAESSSFSVRENRGQIVRLEADGEILDKVAARCGMTKLGCLEIAFSGSSPGEIWRELNKVRLNDFLGESDKVAVRITRLGNVPGGRVEPLERDIGETVISRVPGTKVDLKKPQIILLGVLAENFFILGLRKGPLLKNLFFHRRPRKRPFFHATAMSVKLSRCMVNLARPRRDDLILDPFCGTGSILVEAGLMGFRIIGGDVKERMVSGCYANLKHFRLDAGLVIHDARKTPFRSVDCMVADPPYGRASTTIGLDARDLLQAFFQESTHLLRKGGHICLAFPKELDVKKIGEKVGFNFVESHFLYVHRSLTREIAVFRKDN